MKFLKKIFALNGRLDRKGYLLLGVLPMLGFFTLTLIPSISKINFIIVLILFVPIFILALISVVKRGRDSGLNSFGTLFLFIVVPVIVIVLAIRVDIDIIFYLAYSFIAYLLLMPSSSKDLKVIGKIEYILTMIFIVLVFPLLAMVVVPSVPCAGDKTKVDLTCVNMSIVTRTLDKFKLDNGVYPSTEEGFASLIVNPDVLKYPNYAVDAYLNILPIDAWRGKMLYVKTEDGFELISYGADRKEGGEEYSTDILYSECRK